jgi:hypothetical protein
MLVLLHALWTPITLVLFVLCARPRSNPLQTVAQCLLTATSTRGGRRVLWLGVLILAANALECVFEPALARALGYDLTAWVRSVEGAAVERGQATLPRALLPAAGWFYLSGFVAGLLLPAVVWTAESRFDAVRALVLAYLANYLLALPCYLFVPVREVGWSGLSDARPLLEALYAGISAETRPASALDNCLPSLHASLTASAWAVALAFGDRALRWVTGVIAALTAYVIVALGIHWALDAVVGVPFGVVCAWIGVRLAGKGAAVETG